MPVATRSVEAVRKPERSDRQDADALRVDQERILVGAVGGAAILDHAQPARRDLLRRRMVEQDHAVGDIFLEPLAGSGPSPRSPVMTAVALDP